MPTPKLTAYYSTRISIKARRQKQMTSKDVRDATKSSQPKRLTNNHKLTKKDLKLFVLFAVLADVSSIHKINLSTTGTKCMTARMTMSPAIGSAN